MGRKTAELKATVQLLLLSGVILCAGLARRASAQSDVSPAYAGEANDTATVQDSSGSLIHLLPTGSADDQDTRPFTDQNSSDNPATTVPVLTDPGAAPDGAAAAPTDDGMNLTDGTASSAVGSGSIGISASLGGGSVGGYHGISGFYLLSAGVGVLAIGGAAAGQAFRRKA
jgi:hypothetical protein